MSQTHAVNISGHKMDENNIRLISMGSGKLRLVTHLNYTDKMHGHFLSILNRF